MTQHPNPPLGGDQEKVEPVAWRLRAPGASHWAYEDTGALEGADGIEVQPLYAAPVLPVEMREKIARLIEGDVWRDSGVRSFDGPVTKIDWSTWVTVDAILSTIKGDA